MGGTGGRTLFSGSVKKGLRAMVAKELGMQSCVTEKNSMGEQEVLPPAPDAVYKGGKREQDSVRQQGVLGPY